MDSYETSDRRAAATLAAIPEDSHAGAKLRALDWEPTGDPLKVKAVCPECDHRSLPYVIDSERFTIRGKCQCSHCSYSDWGGTIDGGTFPLSWCRNPSAPVTHDSATGDLAVHRVACGSRKSDPKGCGRFHEYQWASLIANTFRDGAWIGVAVDTDREKDRLGTAARRKGAKWFGIPAADGQRVYVSSTELPKVEMVWVSTGERTLYEKAHSFTKAIPHDDPRRVSHAKSITSWRKRRGSSTSGRQLVGFAQDARQSLQLVADTAGIGSLSDSLMVLTQAERDSEAGRLALEMVGVEVRGVAVAQAGEAVSTSPEIIQGDGSGAPADPHRMTEAEITEMFSTQPITDDAAEEILSTFWEPVDWEAVGLAGTPTQSEEGSSAEAEVPATDSYALEALVAPERAEHFRSVSVSPNWTGTPERAVWRLSRKPEMVGSGTAASLSTSEVTD